MAFRGQGRYRAPQQEKWIKTDEERRAGRPSMKPATQSTSKDFRPHSSSVKNHRFLTASPRGKRYGAQHQQTDKLEFSNLFFGAVFLFAVITTGTAGGVLYTKKRGGRMAPSKGRTIFSWTENYFLPILILISVPTEVVAPSQ